MGPRSRLPRVISWQVQVLVAREASLFGQLSSVLFHMSTGSWVRQGVQSRVVGRLASLRKVSRYDGTNQSHAAGICSSGIVNGMQLSRSRCSGHA